MEAFAKVGLEIEESEALKPGPGFQVDLNVLANRPDCLGIIGIAREIAAHFGLKLKYPQFSTLVTAPGGASPVAVEIRDADLCARYIGRVMSGVKVAPSPQWLQDVLRSIGQRPINNVVDITNFVMFEWGQPLHAFDFTRVRGKRIIVRRLQPGEKLELLGGKTIDAGTANAPTLAICDAEGPVALAGVMGGKQSETRDDTTEVLVEAAHFDPETIRRTSKRIEVSTESSYRFERGVDPNRMLVGAMYRACSLIAELAGGKPAGAPADAYPKERQPAVFKLTPHRVSSYLGTEMDFATIKDSLEKLEMDVSDELSVRVPTWRVDATDPVVLIEDVARMIGYDTLPMRPTPQAPTLGRRSNLQSLRGSIAEYLASVGYLECVSPAMDVPEQVSAVVPDADKSALRLKNPMSRDFSVLRPSLLPALVRIVERNARRGALTSRAFEQDNVFRRAATTGNGDASGEPVETWMTAAVAGGLLNESDWSGGNRPINFYDVKGAVEDLLDIAGVRSASFEPATRRGYVNDATAAIVTGDARTIVGYVGQLDPSVLPIEKTPFKLFGFELELESLLAAHASVVAYRPLARTPAVVRDLAFVVKVAENFIDIENTIRSAAGPALESIRLVDIYQGQPVPAGHRSMALRLTFRDPQRTLTADEVQAQVDRIVETMQQKFSATLRA
jgi:phenylalanyl-tRNA synthetase beta chain